MRKLLYSFISFVILCISFFSTSKKAEEKRIEEQGSDKLILRPFHMFGLLWSCSPDHYEEDNHSSSDPTHYSELVDSTTNSDDHSSHYSGTHLSHYSSTHYSHGNHSSHYSETHSSHYSETHSSHYSGTHQSHQSHSSHSSHYSAK